MFFEKMKGIPNEGSRKYSNSENGETVHATTWKLSDLAPGKYRLHAKWKPLEPRDGMALGSEGVGYRIQDGEKLLETVMVDQTQQPTEGSRSLDGFLWKDLGTFNFQSGSMSVELLTGSNPKGFTLADAIWVEEIQ